MIHNIQFDMIYITMMCTKWHGHWTFHWAICEMVHLSCVHIILVSNQGIKWLKSNNEERKGEKEENEMEIFSFYFNRSIKACQRALQLKIHLLLYDFTRAICYFGVLAASNKSTSKCFFYLPITVPPFQQRLAVTKRKHSVMQIINALAFLFKQRSMCVCIE